MKKKKLFLKLLGGNKNIRFSEAVSCAEAFGFCLARVKESHPIFIHQDIDEVLNLQNVKGQAKPYQVKQLVKLIEIYHLEMKEKQ